MTHSVAIGPPPPAPRAVTRRAAHGWTRRGLQVRVLILVGFGLLASLAIMGGASWLYLNALGRQLLAERELLARSVADHVEYILQEDLETLQGISAAGSVNFEDGDTEPERAAIADANVRGRLLERVWVVNKNGTWLSAQGLVPSADFAPLTPIVREAESSGRPTVSSTTTRAVPGRSPGGAARRGDAGHRVYGLVPLRNWHGQVVAVAVGEIQPDGPRFRALLASTRLSGSASVDLLDAAGLVLASSDPTRRGFSTGQAPMLSRVLTQHEAVTETCRDCPQPGNRARPVIEVLALAPLAAAPWTVSVRQPEREAFATVYSLGNDTLLLGSVLLVLALIFAWGVGRSVRTPLALLTRSAVRIAEGDLDQPIPELPEDEVGRLGEALEHMRVALKASIEDVERANAALEQRVKDRTAELERLYRQLQEREEWRGQLLAKVIGAQEDERRRLARELHDETSQTLNALVMRLETAVAAFPSDVSRQRLVEAKDLTVRTLDELHRLIYDLRPSVLDDLGLLSAVRWYAERNLEPLGVAVHWEFSGMERRLQPEVETALFRVMQEAITNIAKYAHAESVLIQCVLKDDGISLEIEDDGDGFDPASLPPAGSARRGLGLMGMRERVELLGGTIDIDAAPGAGVRIVVNVPLRETVQPE